MSDWSSVLDVVTIGAALLLMGLGFALAAIMPGIDRWNKRFFMGFFGILFLLFSTTLAEIIFSGILHMAGIVRIVEFLLFLFAAVPMIMLAVFLLHCCEEDWRKSPFFMSSLALWGLYYILIVTAQFSSFFYKVKPDGMFESGQGYALIIVLSVVIELINLAGLIKRRGQLKRKYFYTILTSLLPLTIATIVHLFVPVFAFIDISIAVLAHSMYIIILSDQIDEYLRQQQEIANQRASITVLQMRPHFIHNTLMSIYYLCRQDPEEAQRVTLDFNNYLEKNLTAIVSDRTIPFSEELAHTRAYLNVEQALYDESLFVDYDTPHTRFKIPPLTVQPIVENSIKHALDPDSEPIHIMIQSRETDTGSEIIISDNGPGYEPTDDGRPHIALVNIRQRLELMCGGKMTILPREGGGTVVRLTIPRIET